MTSVSEMTKIGLDRLHDDLRQEKYARTPEELQKVLTSCQEISQGIQGAWRSINELLDHGEEGRRLRLLLLELRDAVTRALSLFGQVRERISEPAASLDETTQHVRTIGEELEPILALLELPLPSPDLTSIAAESGRYVGMDELKSRILTQ
jgi:hypothetical protein